MRKETFSPTSIDPEIATSDLSASELLLLDALFDRDETNGKIYYYHSRQIPEQCLVKAEDLEDAFEQANDHSIATELCRATLLKAPLDLSTDKLKIDFSDFGWIYILQDVIKRSTQLDFVIVTTLYYSFPMEPGVMAANTTMITAHDMKNCSTTQWTEDRLIENEHGLQAHVVGNELLKGLMPVMKAESTSVLHPDLHIVTFADGCSGLLPDRQISALHDIYDHFHAEEQRHHDELLAEQKADDADNDAASFAHIVSSLDAIQIERPSHGKSEP
jgi:hypothetical protein